MKRKDFLKRLGIGLGVAIVAPKVLAEMPGKEEQNTDKGIYLGDIFRAKNGHEYVLTMIGDDYCVLDCVTDNHKMFTSIDALCNIYPRHDWFHRGGSVLLKFNS